MSNIADISTGAYDAIVVGGGHNGLVATAYLAKAGLRPLLVEARPTLGGPCGTFEFLPGYRCAFTNSPGSFEPRFIAELQLEQFGLKFVRVDPTVVHPFPRGAFIGWRDRDRLAAQFDAYAPGEAERYFDLLSDLEELGRHLGASMFEPSPDLVHAARGVPDHLTGLFDRVMCGSLRQLLDERLRSEEAKALLGMLALNATLTPPSAPGSAVGLMMRPISLASYAALDEDDPRRAALRGSTGLPVGGMGAIIDALEACCLAHGATILKGAPVARILHASGRACGVVTATGNEFRAPVVLSAINPKTLFGKMLDDVAVGADVRREISAVPMRGSAFKLVLALDSFPRYAGLPTDVQQAQAAQVQFRIAPSLDYIERAIADGLAGRLAERPIMWGLMLSATSPGLAPAGHQLLSVNAWHAPYTLTEESWPEAGERFANICIDELSNYMPDLRQRLVGLRYLNPIEIEGELGLVQSNITHGDMLPNALFGARPHRKAHDYRTPLSGLYLSGGGTWPGGYVTGIPGYNAANTIINDLNSKQ
ncbi:NAD(P)/FAD-dependent oxidoreductase [Shinella sp.]|uniref:phytoene desaturase family protein n=1 Tax=Shinella sp. TaxID=1870904 RepID=UPI0029B09A74|nr:NAD(P)/FAD-dependent oxidoreductase [Shinella sp.]MDX3973790.1 NAD(P)/FAD-dependent oxidoreductase [Shinella sp.]